jgi:hypothetical protein
MSLPIFHKNKWLTLFVFFSQQTTTHPHPDARLERQHPKKLVFVVGDGEEASGLLVLLMVIFGLFVNIFFLSFLLVPGVVGFFWCFLLILGQMGIFEVGIFVDRWRGYSRRISTTSWTKIRRRSRRIHRPFLQILPDLAGYTGPFSRSPDLDDVHRPFLRIPYTILERKKKK